MHTAHPKIIAPISIPNPYPRSLPASHSQISNRNRRRNKEKKKLREAAPETTGSPMQTHHQHQSGRRTGGADAAPGVSSSAADGAAPEGSVANYFSGRKRQKGDAPTAGQEGLGLLLDRGRSTGDGRGMDDTMEFMEVCGVMPGRCVEGVDVAEWSLLLIDRIFGQCLTAPRKDLWDTVFVTLWLRR